MSDLGDLNLKLHSLVIFRSLLNDNVLKLLPDVLSQGSKGMVEKIADYSHFAHRLFQENENLTDYLWNRMLSDQNIYILKCARKEVIDPLLEETLMNELKTLEEISQLTGQEIKKAIGYAGYLPEWKNRQVDFVRDYRYRVDHISTMGYGVFSEYRMFSIVNAKVVPVKSPDPIRFSDLKGYERERKSVIDNTKALLHEKPAANVLLYGDAGTGKSSTVKAIVNEFANQGLRLIEIRKNQLLEIPAIMESLYENPLKFILFIDDLSFAKNNEEVGVLKAILEGTASAKASNTVIYATSNRRHLVNETFSDRGNDDIHINETIQEQVSLSERFGLSVNFSKPNKDQYLTIVHALAEQYGIQDTAELNLRAERHALERGGRSPRIARQFVEYLKSMES